MQSSFKLEKGRITPIVGDMHTVERLFRLFEVEIGDKIFVNNFPVFEVPGGETIENIPKEAFFFNLIENRHHWQEIQNDIHAAWKVFYAEYTLNRKQGRPVSRIAWHMYFQVSGNGTGSLLEDIFKTVFTTADLLYKGRSLLHMKKQNGVAEIQGIMHPIGTTGTPLPLTPAWQNLFLELLERTLSLPEKDQRRVIRSWLE